MPGSRTYALTWNHSNRMRRNPKSITARRCGKFCPVRSLNPPLHPAYSTGCSRLSGSGSGNGCSGSSNLRPQHPTASKFLFWTVMLGAAATLCAFLIRYWTRADRIPSLPTPSPLQRTLRSWQEWMTDARDASANGDYRQAIRCAYWAGISRLQQDRSIRIDFADTPRERLRLLAEPAAQWSASSF